MLHKKNCKFDYEISKIANEVTKIRRTVKKVASLLWEASFFYAKVAKDSKVS